MIIFFILTFVVVIALFLQKQKVPVKPPYEPPVKLNEASWPFPPGKKP